MSAHERERLSAWLDGELAPAERAEVEAHLSACAECRRLLADMGAVDEKARDLPLEAPEGYFDTFPGRLRARIEAQGGRPLARPSGGTWRPPAWTWAAAAALILAVVTPLTMTRLGDTGAPAHQVRTEDAIQAPVAESSLEEKDAPLRDKEAKAEPEPQTPRPVAARTPEALQKGQAVRERRADAPPTRPAVPAEAPAAAPPAAPDPQDLAEARDEMFATAPPSEGKSEEAASSVGAPQRQARAAGVISPEAEEARPLAVTGTEVAGRGAAAVRAPAGVAADEAVGGTGQEDTSEDLRAFARLSQEPAPRDAAGWRERRDAWQAFAAAHPDGPEADEARVRAIEAGLEAWQAGSDRADLDRVRADAGAYLDREDARQSDRVRQALEAVQEN